MYKNVSYTEHTLLHKETTQVTTIDDEIWTAISFSPDSNDNQSDFDIPFFVEPPFFERRFDNFKRPSPYKRGSGIRWRATSFGYI